MSEEQTYKNHTRWYPLFHFVVVPLLILNLLDHLVRIFTNTGQERVDQIFWTIMSVTLILLALSARLMALKAQDRVIRLEEKLRCAQLLSPETALKANGLTASQLIALRFASDEEFGSLVERTLSGEFADTKEIKQAIQTWRPDLHRV